jgi:hypothetical protein
VYLGRNGKAENFTRFYAPFRSQDEAVAQSVSLRALRKLCDLHIERTCMTRRSRQLVNQ